MNQARPSETPTTTTSHPRALQPGTKTRLHIPAGNAPPKPCRSPPNYISRRAPPIAPGGPRARCTPGNVVPVRLAAVTPLHPSLPPLSNGGLNFPRTLCATYALASHGRRHLPPAGRANQTARREGGGPSRPLTRRRARAARRPAPPPPPAVSAAAAGGGGAPASSPPPPPPSPPPPSPAPVRPAARRPHQRAKWSR